jgi:hypothetical protein
MERKIFVIGCGAVGRVGKDLLAKCLFSLFDLDGYDCKIYSLANALKQDVSEFLESKLGYDVWTQDTAEKAKFRDFLVWYGKQKREATQGTYWTSIVEKQILQDSKEIYKQDRSGPFIAIVPDIRYAQYSQDEDRWVQNNTEWMGKLIHVTRYDGDGGEFKPLNTDESLNNPMIKKQADYRFKWGPLGDFPQSFSQSEHYKLVKPLFENLVTDIKVAEIKG